MLKHIVLWVLGSLLLLQFVQIPIPDTPKNIDKDGEIKAPKHIVSILKTSCYDCHSYQTNIPWYGNIAPVSWEVRSHIIEGSAWVNFEKFNTYSQEKKEKIYKGIAKSINFRMPIPMYLKMHEDAKLTQAQRKEIKMWAKSYIKD